MRRVGGCLLSMVYHRGKRMMLYAAAVVALGLGAGIPELQAVGIANPNAGADGYWTAERLRAAKPLPLPKAGTTLATGSEAQARVGTSGEQRSGLGRPPSTNIAPDWSNRLFEPAGLDGRVGQLEPVAPQAIGTSGLPFTTLRVFPDQAVSTYPYRAAGKLFFRDARKGTDNVCSASVISRRLVVTAGHCVFETVQNYFYTNFLFVPAFRNGAAPFRQWSWAFVHTTAAWVNGNGSFPNNGDFAIIETVDQAIGGATRRIGDVVGFLGWITNGLVGQHLHTLGYPTNLDNGQRMQETTAETRRVSGFNAGQLGSDQRGGSSGGPWIRDFGVNGTGNPVPAAQRNLVVGVTSYGPIAIGPRYQGSSIFDNSFVQLRNQACARRAGNC
jgi:V8-like Glu-specific endopeptidase